MAKRQLTKYPQYIKASTNGSDDELLAFGESIPMDPLFDKLREVTGLPNLEFTYEVVKYSNGVGVTYESQDIAEYAGFLQLMFKTLKIESFNSSIFYDEEENRGLCLWTTVSFRYKHQDGGSNGDNFMTAWYSETYGWDFEIYRDKNY